MFSVTFLVLKTSDYTSYVSYVLVIYIIWTFLFKALLRLAQSLFTDFEHM